MGDRSACSTTNEAAEVAAVVDKEAFTVETPEGKGEEEVGETEREEETREEEGGKEEERAETG